MNNELGNKWNKENKLKYDTEIGTQDKIRALQLENSSLPNHLQQRIAWQIEAIR